METTRVYRPLGVVYLCNSTKLNAYIENIAESTPNANTTSFHLMAKLFISVNILKIIARNKPGKFWHQPTYASNLLHEIKSQHRGTRIFNKELRDLYRLKFKVEVEGLIKKIQSSVDETDTKGA